MSEDELEGYLKAEGLDKVPKRKNLKGEELERYKKSRANKEMSECLDRYCNGPKVCIELVEGTTDQYMCEAGWWCPFHPNYKKSEKNKKIWKE